MIVLNLLHKRAGMFHDMFVYWFGLGRAQGTKNVFLFLCIQNPGMMNFMYTYTKNMKEADTHRLGRPPGESRRRN